MVVFLYRWYLVVAVGLMGFASHPFHVSTTEVNHNAEDKTLEISCHIFTDDFEDAIRREYGSAVDFSRASMKPLMDSLAKKYVLNHLSMKVNNRAVQMACLGWELEREAVYVYLQVDGINAVSQVEVTNSILFNLYTDQMNIMHVKVNGERKSHKMTYPEKNSSMRF